MSRSTLLPLLGIGSLILTGCVANDSGSGDADSAADGDVITVTITDTTCDVSTSSIPSGRTSFRLVNEGTVRNEFEILAEDQLRIIGERENLGPGTTTDYTVLLEEGSYYTACKKNMIGSLVDAREFTVTQGEEIEVSADDQEIIDEAVTNYTAYIRDQAGQLLEATQQFVADYKAGNEDAAREQYPVARMHYERIEPTAEAFGDIDPELDEREADYQEADDTADREWTGWHRLEKDLWRPDGFEGLTDEEKEHFADLLLENTQELYDLVYSEDFSVNIDDISNGAISLLEEVATTKITGEEEAFSHTDLYDFQANLEGAKVAYGNVSALAEKNDADLADTISSRIDALQAGLDKYRDGDGFVSYDTLDDTQRRELSDLVDALRVPLAKLTEAIV